VTQNVILNLKSPQAIQTDIAFTQGDYGEAKLTIAVKDDEQYITGDTGASISFLRADGNIVTGDLTGTKGMYAYTFKGNELEAAGKIVATVTIKYTGGRVSTAAFVFTARYNPTYDRKIPAGPYITELEKIKEQAQTYVEYLSALIEQLQPDIGSTALTKADLINGYTQTVAGIKAFDAAAAKTLKELVDGKIDATKIVNNLLSTDASMVLSAALGPIIDQRLTDLLEKYNRLNGEMVNGKLKGYIEVGDEDDIIEILQTLFNGYGFSYITISNPSKNVPSGFSYSGGFVVHRWDTLSVILLSYSISKIAINSCIKKNNAYTWTGWKIFTGNS
jgi:hypothetical protein